MKKTATRGPSELAMVKERSMKGFLSKVHGLSRFLNVIAGIALVFLMFLTLGMSY